METWKQILVIINSSWKADETYSECFIIISLIKIVYIPV